MDEKVTPVTEDVDVTCPAMGYQSAEVCVAVTVTPSADVGKPETKCCGPATVSAGGTPCSGTKNGTCTFVISQIVCVSVPVVFSATAEHGDTYVNCLGASDEACPDCNNGD